MPDGQASKSQLRHTLRRRRQALGDQARSAAAAAIPANIQRLPAWTTARQVALYLASDAEMGTGPLFGLCHSQGKKIFLPVINSDQSLSFAHWQCGAELRPNRYGIGEPADDAPRCPVAQLDMVILPLVGWDRQGGRLGMGGGFYDRSLAGASDVLRVGLAYAIQEVDRIPREDWDIPLDYVVTETALHRCAGSGG